MTTIKELENKGVLVSPVFFERTERRREHITEMSREELIDYSYHLLQILERHQGMAEKMNEELEKSLGYHDPLKR